METKENTLRSVGRIVPSQHKQIGIFPVRTPSISRRSKEIDPFLQLDHIGPVAISATQGQTPDYLPHKGFEILTYLMEGHMEHTDSQGNHGLLQPGDVQLLRTGRGSMHYENNQRTLDGKGDTMHKVQLWINLPGRKKQLTPSYQHIPSYQLPTISLDNVLMKVLAGEWNGESSPYNDTSSGADYAYFYGSRGRNRSGYSTLLSGRHLCIKRIWIVWRGGYRCRRRKSGAV
jgi:redox-sensitive bicupin YhaK (pirin superfamily)